MFSDAEENTWTEISIDVSPPAGHFDSRQDTQLCVWRLFSEHEDSADVDGDVVRSRKMLDYEFYFYANQTENAEVFLFDYDSKQGGSVLE